jgi:hypothetical protein
MDASPSYSPIDVTDVLAVVLLVLASVRRMDVKLSEARDFPHLPPPVFEEWKVMALRGYGLWITGCGLKVVLNTIWFFGARGRVHPMLLAAVGTGLFVLWVVLLVIAWRRVSNARRRQAQLGIVLKRRSERAEEASRS